MTQQTASALKDIFSGPPRRIAVLSHNNPDGDAVGSSLALARLLDGLGHSVTCAVPNRFPAFLSWMSDAPRMMVYKTATEQVAARIAEAEVIVCVDFNHPSRLEALAPVLEANTTAQRVLIDHHLQPDENFDVVLSDTAASSTCYLIYEMIAALYGTGAIDAAMGESLYVGMMTDTGNFSFSNLSPDLFRAVAVLVEKGIDIPRINSSVYNSYSEGRMRLVGYSLFRKMEIVEPYNAAYISLTEAELRKFNFQMGDTEGIVNLPLAIGSVGMSAMFVSTRQFIRVSLRSKGDVDVNDFARRFFNGGGHRNASGGKSFMTMPQTIEHYRKSLAEFFGE